MTIRERLDSAIAMAKDARDRSAHALDYGARTDFVREDLRGIHALLLDIIGDLKQAHDLTTKPVDAVFASTPADNPFTYASKQVAAHLYIDIMRSLVNGDEWAGDEDERMAAIHLIRTSKILDI